MSYTTFKYGPLRLAADHVAKGKSLVAEVTVSNTGPRDGQETVFWYVPPVGRLDHSTDQGTEAFRESHHRSRRSRAFRFTIDVDRDLSYPDAHGNRIVDRGTIVLTAGAEQTRFEVR